ncbi:MAG: SCP2 sterol-binding domain-containing protein [Desulfamplus sp.]|nr:SCP2 sterol-binding domain-containing protein [Desulfamplus sp.]
MAVQYRPIVPGIKRFKILVIKIVFIVLGRAFQSASQHDEEIRKEISSWRDGFTLIMKVMPDGPYMGLEKKNNMLEFKGSQLKQADFEIYFKNVESAFMIMTPQMGSHQAFAERRMSIKGDLGIATVFTRVLVIVMSVLYPEFIVKRLVKRVPPLTLKRAGLRVWLYTLGILLGK